ncbi:hypothetical protein [Bradyrhizobium liaoningense]|uniref:hypothetical protein n=1 Tax=Bradyrhizobium liaoningense TaxID=43992 RepID=UPI001BAC7377|nr:hypothetical protein [Bradyrhizobium liaoningense]MBR0855648.1 hypothetical protein [Bradyrhizobium liaoningense]
MFLVLVAGILLFFIVTLSVFSQHCIFEKLEPAFVGALVAASGTIFAGCIAYSAASENIRVAEQARADAIAERNALTAKVAKDAQDAKLIELRAIQGLKQTVDRLAGQFDGATDSGEKDYFQMIFDAEQYGRLTPRVRRTVPEDLIARAAEIFDHITGIRNSVMRAIQELNNMTPEAAEAYKPTFEANRAEANGVVKKAVAELKQFSNDLDSEITNRTK